MTRPDEALLAADWIEESDTASVVGLLLCMDALDATDSGRDAAQFVAQIRGHLKALRMTTLARVEADAEAAAANPDVNHLTRMMAESDAVRAMSHGSTYADALAVYAGVIAGRRNGSHSPTAAELADAEQHWGHKHMATT